MIRNRFVAGSSCLSTTLCLAARIALPVIGVVRDGRAFGTDSGTALGVSTVSQTDLISDGSHLRRISSQTDLISDGSH
ncbi:MAG: hypothetical protein CMJ59_07435, partial [Planctomycetaceae bacterium]|nr:hypothetical protein [Planctomycetaceae bacterium]